MGLSVMRNYEEDVPGAAEGGCVGGQPAMPRVCTYVPIGLGFPKMLLTDEESET